MTATQAIEAALAAKAAAREPSGPLRLSASGKCARYLAYWLHFPGLIPPPTPRALAIFELGQAVHGGRSPSGRAAARAPERTIPFGTG